MGKAQHGPKGSAFHSPHSGQAASESQNNRAIAILLRWELQNQDKNAPTTIGYMSSPLCARVQMGQTEQ